MATEDDLATREFTPSLEKQHLLQMYNALEGVQITNPVIIFCLQVFAALKIFAFLFTTLSHSLCMRAPCLMHRLSLQKSKTIITYTHFSLLLFHTTSCPRGIGSLPISFLFVSFLLRLFSLLFLLLLFLLLLL